MAPELRGERRNICEGLERVQEENLKGKGCKILGMIYRKAYQGQSPDPTFLFALVFWEKKKKNYGSCAGSFLTICSDYREDQEHSIRVQPKCLPVWVKCIWSIEEDVPKM